MKKFTIYFLLIFSVLLVSCNKDDSNSVKIRDRQEVYDEDIVEIEEYLQNNYLDINLRVETGCFSDLLFMSGSTKTNNSLVVTKGTI